MATDTMTSAPPLTTLFKYFGPKPGQSLTDFKNEVNELTDEDKATLAESIRNGTLTY